MARRQLKPGKMNLNIQHRSVKANILLVSVLAQELEKLEEPLGINSAWIDIAPGQQSASLSIRVMIDTATRRIVAEILEKEPGEAMLESVRAINESVERFGARSSGLDRRPNRMTQNRVLLQP